MARTKAGFRALREALGYSQADIAAIFDVNIRSVRRWESERDSAYRGAPPAIWEWLEAEADRRAARVDAALEIVDELAEAGERPDSVRLPYYANQEHYERCRRDEPSDPVADTFGAVNATTREIAGYLRADGYDVEMVYPDAPRDVSLGA